MNTRKRDRTPQPLIARGIAQQRGTSVVLMEITRSGNTLVCEDSASLRESDGRRAVLIAMVVALRDMLAIAEQRLAEEPEPVDPAESN